MHIQAWHPWCGQGSPAQPASELTWLRGVRATPGVYCCPDPANVMTIYPLNAYCDTSLVGTDQCEAGTQRLE